MTSASKIDGARERRSEALADFWRLGTPKKEGERKKKGKQGEERRNFCSEAAENKTKHCPGISLRRL